jgi:hypothetical protein
MEREYWSELTRAIVRVDRHWKDSARLKHRTSLIVRVHLWSVLHDRPMSWACDPRNWNDRDCPDDLPDQSTLSRRTRKKHRVMFESFLGAVAQRLSPQGPGAALLKQMDGKALTVAAHSTDPDARWGRGTGQQAKGYKLHLIRSEKPMPEQWTLTPLNIDERRMAKRMIKRLRGAGYLQADSNYDDNKLHDCAAAANHQLLAPRRIPGVGLGHVYQSPHRIRAIEMLESPAQVNDFGPRLYRRRRQIERDLGNLASFGGGLGGLPSWVRRIWRVRNWVHAKLLINAARIRVRRRQRRAGA